MVSVTLALPAGPPMAVLWWGICLLSPNQAGFKPFRGWLLVKHQPGLLGMLSRMLALAFGAVGGTCVPCGRCRQGDQDGVWALEKAPH